MIFNNFDSRKLVALSQYWQPIKDRVLPHPIGMSLDLGNKCQNSCYFCNAKKIKPKKQMDNKTLDHVIDFLKLGTKSVCIAGGKESLTNPNAPEFIDRILSETKAGVGIITNGVKYHDLNPKIRFINVSVNAGDRWTYRTVCGEDNYNQVLINISKWIKHGHNVTYKYMITDKNKSQAQLQAAIVKANDLKCNTILFRYAGNAWFKGGKSIINITERERKSIEYTLNAFSGYGDLSVKIVFPIDRTDRYSVKETPEFCAGCMINVVVTAEGEVYGCSDHRGNPKLHYCHIKDLKEFWGSEKHWKIIDSVNPKKCPRCSFYQHSKVIDEFVYNDVSNQYFI